MFLSDPFRRNSAILAAGLVWFWMLPADAPGQEPPFWRLAPDLIELGAGPDELFESVRHGRLFPDSFAVVADAGSRLIRVYAPDGRRLAEMGGRGFGPGEFEAIQGLWLTPEGLIGVWDARNQRITTFDREGRVVSADAVRTAGDIGVWNLEVFLGAFSNGDILLAALRAQPVRRPTEVAAERWRLARFSPGGESLFAVGEISGMIRTLRTPIPFSPVGFAVILGDTIVSAEGYAPNVRIMTAAGDSVRSIALPWTIAVPRDPWAELERELHLRESRLFLSLLHQVPRTDSFPPLGGILIDEPERRVWMKVYALPRDALWLKRHALEIVPGGRWWVLDPDEGWVARLEMPDDMAPLHIRGGRILGVRRDALGVERVVVQSVAR